MEEPKTTENEIKPQESTQEHGEPNQENEPVEAPPQTEDEDIGETADSVKIPNDLPAEKDKEEEEARGEDEGEEEEDMYQDEMIEAVQAQQPIEGQTNQELQGESAEGDNLEPGKRE